jgi:hypothetical protein
MPKTKHTIKIDTLVGALEITYTFTLGILGYRDLEDPLSCIPGIPDEVCVSNVVLTPNSQSTGTTIELEPAAKLALEKALYAVHTSRIIELDAWYKESDIEHTMEELATLSSVRKVLV